MDAATPCIDISLLRTITDIDAAEWDSLVGGDGSPFLEWDWLASLEESGCVRADTGWAPHHLVARQGGRLVAAMPLYLKSHSQGEFVFDHGWADAARRAGIRYYPKLLAAVPFTPAAGRRLLTHPAHPRAPLMDLLAAALRELCAANGISSAHVNFCADDEIEPLARAGFLHREGIQFHWSNRGYATFDDYLRNLKHKRRNQIRRERRELAARDLTITVHEGDAIPDALFEPMFRIYLSTIEKMYWGRQYLNSRFFELLRRRFRRHLCFVTARRGGELVAGAIDVQKAGVLYGRYWGAFEEVRNLHFEVCYYVGIEHCIARGWRRFEPGAGGEFKYLRGFLPALTHSLHFVADERLAAGVDRFLRHERAQIEATVAAHSGR